MKKKVSKQDKAAAARGGTKGAAKGKPMAQRSSTVKEHQKGLVKIADETAMRRAAKRGARLDMIGVAGNRAAKKTEKSFKRSK